MTTQMRTIKFRAKTKNEGEWVHSMTIAYGTITRKSKDLFMEVEPNKWKGVDKNTLGQFTGHHDKSGREIYEGDIILCKGNYPYSVEWMTDGFIIRGSNYGGIASIKAFLPCERDVIGNIFDNPELLKGGKDGKL